jgi:hypothetical protein
VSEIEEPPAGLVDFLYLLARDHLPTGKIRRTLNDHVLASRGTKRTYSDTELEAWARQRASEIMSVGELDPKKVFKGVDVQ